MIAHLRRSIISIVVFTAFFGFVYALAGTGVAQLFFRHQADGSITANGSTLIGQNWSSTKCPGNPPGSCVFQGRPDDLGPYSGDNPLVANGKSGESAATNLGPRSKVLVANTQALVAYWHKRGVDPTPDLVTTSGSGLDPDIAPQDAIAQIPMVSKATGIAPSALRALISRETNGAVLGFMGSSYIDVLQLNEALAQLR
ncbi:MAG TPA: potassium-transporting ATPase subunit C [Acidimicrobiales bacterium]|nr:potassium-transporting ATPase subunit C [Acidimicrobiales bacterium]HLN43463.1 potassium-transporting ATPase subunit C [Acidimicrobiales bacterium]